MRDLIASRLFFQEDCLWSAVAVIPDRGFLSLQDDHFVMPAPEDASNLCERLFRPLTRATARNMVGASFGWRRAFNPGYHPMLSC